MFVLVSTKIFFLIIFKNMHIICINLFLSVYQVLLIICLWAPCLCILFHVYFMLFTCLFHIFFPFICFILHSHSGALVHCL